MLRFSKLACQLCLYLALLALLAPRQVFAESELPAFELAKPAENQMVTLSPDGRHVAFIRSKTSLYCTNNVGQMKDEGDEDCSDLRKSYRSKHAIIVYDLKDSQAVKTLNVPANFLVSWVSWATKDRLLVSISRPVTSGYYRRDPKSGGEKIMSIPLYGQDFVFLFGDQDRVSRDNRYRSNVIHKLPDDYDHVIVSANDGNRLSLWKVNILSGEGQIISRGEPSTFGWFTNAKGQPALRFDCEDGIFCPRVSVNSPNPGAELQPEADWNELMRFEIDPLEQREEYEFWPLAPAAQDGQYYVLSDRDDDISAHIKLYDISKKAYVETVYQDPNWDVGGGIFDSTSGAYVGAWQHEDRLEYVFENANVEAHYKAIRSQLGGDENVRLLDYDAENGKAVVYVSSPTIPGDYYLYDLKAKSLSFLLQRYPDLFESLETRTELLDIKTRDGKIIRGYLTSPLAEDADELPLIVMPHGGPEARDYYDYDAEVQYYASYGYRVLKVNFRGSSGYGREFAAAGYGEWGGRMQNDVIDAVRSLYGSGRAEPENSCIVGYSYGGYVALMAGGATPEIFTCIVSGGGVSDLIKTMKAEKSKYGKSSTVYDYWRKSIGDPATDKDKLKALSPVNLAENFQSPVLLIHGERDSNTGIVNSKDMRKALKGAGKQVEFVELEREGHSGWSVDTTILYMERVREFLDAHIGN